MAKQTQSAGKDITEITRATEAALSAEEKVRILIPVDPHNRDDLTVDVGINGCFYKLKRGESVDVPGSVATLLREANYI
jgi:hypothetical protein